MDYKKAFFDLLKVIGENEGAYIGSTYLAEIDTPIRLEGEKYLREVEKQKRAIEKGEQVSPENPAPKTEDTLAGLFIDSHFVDEG